MAEWLAPFHRPYMPSAEFDRLKHEYIQKYGYTLTIPGPEDIFHFGTEVPMTNLEENYWRYKMYDKFTPDRLEEIKYMKKRRKEAFQAMLSSPSPRIFTARASIITVIDDAQDALSTLAGIGTLIYMAVSPAVKRLISGPLGWTMAASDGLNFVNKAMSPEMRMIRNKKLTEKVTKHGPKSSKVQFDTDKKARALTTKEAQKIRLARINKNIRTFTKGGWKGKIVEGLQTTDNVYGIGISLGAIMNLPLDFASLCVRWEVPGGTHIKLPDIDIGHWGRVARRLVRNWLAFEGIPKEYRYTEHHSPVVTKTGTAGIDTIIDNEEEMKVRLGLFLAQQAIHMTADMIDPLEGVDNISDLAVKAPEPTNILTREVIEEAGDRIEDGVAWPATGEVWSNAQDLIEESSQHITDNLNSFCSRNNHSVAGWAVARHSVASGLMMLENVGGTGTVRIEHNPSYRIINSLQWLNFVHEDDITDEQKRMFADYLQRCDDENYTPHAKEVVQYAREYCGFDFVQMIRE